MSKSTPTIPQTPVYSDDEEIARRIFDIIPHLMQDMRVQMRSLVKGFLTIPQFRILAALNLNHDMNHCDLAEHIGVSLPAISRMADLLAGRDLITRVRQVKDKRQIQLQLTVKGKKLFQKYRAVAAKGYANRFTDLSGKEKQLVKEALDILGTAFMQSEEKKREVYLDSGNLTQSRSLRPGTDQRQ